MVVKNQLYLINQLLLFVCVSTQAQYFGGHPYDIKWSQINSKNVRVIFPEGLDKRAFRIADIIEHINANNTYSVGKKSKKLDLVLQTNQVLSNGFVTLAPYRSEFFGTGFQDFHLLGSIDWLDVLSIHEYRHALQYANADRGTIKWAHILGGQYGWAAAMAFTIPNWYFEGDAVLFETLLSKAGRGRTPAFFKEQRANLLGGKEYSYMTSRNGSFKKMLPNHYSLGYAICNYTRNEYGMDIWSKVVADTGRNALWPFSRAMKRHTGKRSHEMYKLAYAQLKQDWEAELKNIQLKTTQPVTEKDKKTVTNYTFAQLLNDGSVVAIKDSFEEISHLVRMQDGEERKLTSYSFTPLNYLSENNGKLAWSELQNDPRRANRNYTRIVTYDISNGTKKYVTSKSKYFSPHVSSKGNEIIVVKADENLQNQLVIISAKNGSVIREIPNPNNDFLSYPKWSTNNQAIIYLVKRNSQIALMKYDLAGGTNTMLTDWTNHTIGATDLDEKYVYFSASFSGIDNIYAVSLNGDKAIKQLTSVKIGAYYPTISNDGKTLIMGEFTDMGYIVTKVTLDSVADKEPFSYIEPREQSRYRIKTNPNEENILDKFSKGSYETKKYKGFFKGTKLHSWGSGRDRGNPSFNLYFDNILTNFKANAGVFYNPNEEATGYIGEIKFGKWFTEIGFKGRVQRRNVSYFSNSVITTESFDEIDYGVSLSTPLRWVKGNYFLGFKPSVEYTILQTSGHRNKRAARADFNVITYEIAFGALRRKALQNIHPRFGIGLDAKYRSSVTGGKTEKINSSSFLFLPGIAKNHGIKINANWQKEMFTGGYRFSDQFVYSRGYKNVPPNDEAYQIAFNYAFPLAYPDWGVGGLIYFKRIRANLFYDMSDVRLKGVSTNLNSFGAELTFDNTFINFLPASVGLRGSFLLNTDTSSPDSKNSFEVFFRIGL